MIVIIGLAILVVAVIVAVVGVLANTGIDHALIDNFSVLGYHVTGSTGALFLCGIAVGAVAVLGLSVLLAGARHTAARGARRPTRTHPVPPADGPCEPGSHRATGATAHRDRLRTRARLSRGRTGGTQVGRARPMAEARSTG